MLIFTSIRSNVQHLHRFDCASAFCGREQDGQWRQGWLFRIFTAEVRLGRRTISQPAKFSKQQLQCRGHKKNIPRNVFLGHLSILTALGRAGSNCFGGNQWKGCGSRPSNEAGHDKFAQAIATEFHWPREQHRTWPACSIWKGQLDVDKWHLQTTNLLVRSKLREKAKLQRMMRSD